MNIPLLDLKAQYKSIKQEIDNAIRQVINKTAFLGGEFVRNFESDFAKALGVKYCLGVGSGSDALFIALLSLGIKKGDEVIVPANTFIATAEAVSAVGAKVIFVDCEPDYYQIDYKKILDKITKKTKAIIVVHLYGHPAPMDEIIDIAKKHDLFIVEDAAHAHLAKYKSVSIGAIGDIGCFSCNAVKILGAYGDAGAIVTNDEEIINKCRLFANHGRIDKYNHILEGYNSRLDSLQASILSAKLQHLAEWKKKRRKVANLYNSLLKIPEIITPKEMPKTESVYHQYVIRCKERDKLKDYLKSNGIETGIHYPTGLPFLEAYSRLRFKAGDFPVTNKLQNEILSLPMYPELTEKQIEYVADAIKKFYRVQK